MSCKLPVHHTSLVTLFSNCYWTKTATTFEEAHRLIATKHVQDSRRALLEQSTICGEQSHPLLLAISQRPCRRPVCAHHAPDGNTHSFPPRAEHVWDRLPSSNSTRLMSLQAASTRAILLSGIISTSIRSLNEVGVLPSRRLHC